MTPKEKAKELVDKFNGKSLDCTCLEYMCVCSHISYNLAKQCALICVYEIQEHAQMIDGKYEGYFNAYQFFKKVKQEIKKL